MENEIGSEFWLNSVPDNTANEVPHWLQKYGDTVLTSSGRGAITLLLQQIQPVNKSVLLPAYICESVILPFIEQGYDCYYYEVEENLTPNIENINSYKNIGVFLHMGYYGFPTNSNLKNVVKSLREQSTIIVEDLTHTLFSTHDRFESNDYFVGSIRKWIGIPSGGFLTSTAKLKEQIMSEDNAFSKMRLEALINKSKYIRTNEPHLKELSLKQFSEAENCLGTDFTPYSIDKLSGYVLSSLNEKELVMKRKENFISLSKGVKTIVYIKPLFEQLDENVCPMFFPILIKEARSSIRNKLAEQGIYCPIHWPVPQQVKIDELNTTLKIYNSILSIPCDQRYEREDMERIISVLESIH